MTRRKIRLRDEWRTVKTSSQFRNVLLFLVFVAISIAFWFILALNDSVTHTFSVRLNMINVPDTVTFISEPPADMHVTVRDKGTNILRSGVVKNPTVTINFNDYAHQGVFRMTKADIFNVMKNSFGSGIQISSMSLDSLRLYYTDAPGKVVPISVRVDCTASSGNIIAGPPQAIQRTVRIFSYGNETDTINEVRTKVLKRSNLSQTSVLDVEIEPIRNVRIEPSAIKVRVNVEPLVLKEGYAQIEARGVPAGESLLLFPARVPVSYYVPMSMFNDEDLPVNVYVDFEDTRATMGNRLPVKVGQSGPFIVNPQLRADSVEYTLIRK